MQKTKLEHMKWGKYLSPKNCIQVNPVKGHINYPAHDHQFIEIVFVLSGTCQHRSVLGNSQAVSGDVFLFRPGAWHAYENTQNLFIYNCCFDPVILAGELGWTVENPLLGPLLWSIPLAPSQHGMLSLHLPSRELKRCHRLLNEMITIGRADSLGRYEDLIGLLILLLNVLGRNLAAKLLKPGHTKPHPSVTRSISLINNEPAENWTLSSLAKSVHVEPNYFVRIFRTATGLTPMAYLTRRRLELATGLLRNSKHSVGEVGALVGWPDANHFTRLFRKKFGLPPSQYRARVTAVKKKSTALKLASKKSLLSRKQAAR